MRRLTLALMLLLVLAPSAHASGRDVINDCTDDEVMAKTYTQKEYRDALAQLPADADQYGDCRDIIARAQEAAATKGSTKSSGHGSAPAAGASGGGGPSAPSSAKTQDQLAAASPADRAAAAEAARSSQTTDAGLSDPAATAAQVGRAPGSSGVSDLPTAVLVLLALLLAGALALAAVRIRRLVHTRGA